MSVASGTGLVTVNNGLTVNGPFGLTVNTNANFFGPTNVSGTSFIVAPMANFNNGLSILGGSLNVNAPSTFNMPANFNNGLNASGGPVNINGVPVIMNGPGTLNTNNMPVNFTGGIVSVGVAGGIGEALEVNSGYLAVNNSAPLQVNGGSVDIIGGPLNVNGGPVSVNGGPVTVNGGSVDIFSAPLNLNGGPLQVNGGPVMVNGGPLFMNGGPIIMPPASSRIGVGTGSPVNNVDVAGSQVIGTAYAGSVTAPTNSLLVEGEVGVGYTSSPGPYRLYVNGNTWTLGGYFASDMRWKENVTPVTDALAKVMKMQGVTYDFRKDDQLNFPEGRQIGFIAQELEKVVPEVVMTNGTGYKGVAYQNLTALLTEAVKDQQNEITRLNAKIDRLEAMINKMTGNTLPPAQGTSQERPDLR